MTRGSAIRAAVLLPPRDALPALGAPDGALLAAYARQSAELELILFEQDGSPADRARAMRTLVRQQEPLALVASFTDGADAELAAAADELEVPLLATLSSHPRSSVTPHRWLRDLCGGVIEQSAALLRSIEAKKVALLHDDDDVARRVAGAYPFHAARATAGDLAGFDAVLFASAEGAHLLPEITGGSAILIAAAALPPSLFDRIRPREVWLALPTCARDESPPALAAFRSLVQRHDIATDHRIALYAALTSLQLFLDAVRRCGDDLTRASLLQAIDATRGFSSGLFPPLTYGASRHIGSTGAWIVPVHKARSVAPVWVDDAATPTGPP
jgi:hypothetical protein